MLLKTSVAVWLVFGCRRCMGVDNSERGPRGRRGPAGLWVLPADSSCPPDPLPFLQTHHFTHLREIYFCLPIFHCTLKLNLVPTIQNETIEAVKLRTSNAAQMKMSWVGYYIVFDSGGFWFRLYDYLVKSRKLYGSELRLWTIILHLYEKHLTVLCFSFLSLSTFPLFSWRVLNWLTQQL